ncbi:hypothetical protein N0O92_13005 [Alkalihalobacillus sp. MEB130]|uniref:hypothetical protein n=1 Tax=Alkalihalobacillus sp. MEB130 TaxID=2976704 RepID=UPI0028E03EA4|nr:hypothetical protein [Alkalihalobacillus sp. MEB130]MDT8861154.1 hypothetical protein [Alkalihalobacillus sp. MEB130]
MRGLFIITIFYVFVSSLFYFNGFNGFIGGDFFMNVKSIYRVGEQVPLALGLGLVYFWALLGSVYYLTNSKARVKDEESRDSEELIAASKED